MGARPNAIQSPARSIPCRQVGETAATPTRGAVGGRRTVTVAALICWRQTSCLVARCCQRFVQFGRRAWSSLECRGRSYTRKALFINGGHSPIDLGAPSFVEVDTLPAVRRFAHHGRDIL